MVMEPPPQQQHRSIRDWSAVLQQLRTDLPADYKEFVDLYGAGCAGRFIWVYDPFTKNRNINLVEQVRCRGEILRGIRQRHPSEVPFPVFPEVGGFLPWGTSDNGDAVGWVTEGAPNDWASMVVAARDSRTFRFQERMTAFLARLLTRQVTCPIFPPDFPPPHPDYVKGN